jgi:hypothetical protein
MSKALCQVRHNRPNLERQTSSALKQSDTHLTLSVSAPRVMGSSDRFAQNKFGGALGAMAAYP